MPRKPICLCFVALAIGWLWALPVAAQSPAVARADSLYTAGARQEARAELDALIRAANDQGDTTSLRDALYARGRQAAGIGQAREAAQDLALAERLARRTGQDAMARNALRWWGYAQLSLGDRDSATSLYDRLLAESLRTQDRYHEAQARFGLAYIDLLAGDLRAARLGYESSLGIFRELGQTRDELYLLVGLARVLTDEGDVPAAREVYGSILERSTELDLRQPAAQALNNLAILEFELGSADRAVEHYRAAAELYTEMGESAEVLGVTQNLSNCLLSLGRLDEAEALNDSALRRAERAGYRERIVNLLVGRCDLARVRHKPALAESCITQAFTYFDAASVTDRLALLLARARTHAGADPARASAELEGDSAKLRELVSPAELAELDVQRAHLLLAAGRAAEALHVAGGAAEHAAKAESRLNLLRALVLAARAAQSMGESEQARQSLQDALSTWESIRGTPRDPEWRERWGALSRDLAAEFASLLLEAEAPPDAAAIASTFLILQRFKARTFIERLTGFGALAGGDSLRVQALAELADIGELQAVLHSDEMLLDLHESSEGTLVFMLTRDDLQVRRLPAGHELAERGAMLWQIVSQPPTEESADLDAAAEAAIRAWARDFLAPLTDLTAQHPHLLVAADRGWHVIPFEAIGELAPEFAIDVTRIPSAQVLLQLRARRQERNASEAPAKLEGLLIASSFGGEGELLGSLREARSLVSRFRNLSARIDEPVDLESLQQVQWLHFAMHADADAQRPWNSTLVFQQLGVSERALTAYDVLSLRLDLRLCVLSACESAVAQVLPGEGMLGLASAFLIAGSDAVVAALWKVDDQTTARFMQTFYDSLAEGSTAAAALRTARREIRDRRQTRHPYYWAGFCLIGEPAGKLPLTSAPPRRAALILGSLGLLGVGAVIFLRRRTL